MRRTTSKPSLAAAASTALALLLLAVAPAFTGIVLVHDHGEGLHLHRGAAEASFHGHADHARGLHGHRAEGGESVAPAGDGATLSPPDASGFVVRLPRVGVASPPAPVPPPAAPYALDLPSIFLDLSAPPRCRRPARLPGASRAPPRSGTLAVLLASHALLI